MLSEKEALAEVMERHGFEWEHKGTHEKHLSVYEYEKKMRAQEVAELTEKADGLKKEIEIYYSYVGIVNVPTAEELEALRKEVRKKPA